MTIRVCIAFLALLVAQASAQPATLTVHWNENVRVRYQVPGQAWSPLSKLGTTFELPIAAGTEKVAVQVVVPGWFWQTVYSEDEFYLHRELKWSPTAISQRQPTGLGTALLLSLLAPLGLGVRAAVHYHRRKLVQTAEEVEVSQSYFPTDGSLPKRVGPYRVQGKLGAGGMGVVFRCLDKDQKAVAVKVPLPHVVEDPEFVRRFNREMKLGVELHHPGLTRIDFYVPAGGEEYPYIVMELLEGQGLDDVPFPVGLRQGLDWLVQILQVLEHVHGQGIVHRDLKPSNLFLTPKGVKVTDLGIAYNPNTIDARLTASGTILGTPIYLDPAMVTGVTADSRSDLYTLGIIAFEMFAGKVPYPEDVMQIITLKMTQPFPALHDHRPDLPEELSQWVASLTERDIERRVPSARAAREALERIQAQLGFSPS